MHRNETKKRPPGRLRRVPQMKKGYRTAAYRLRPDQIEALRQEALRRAVAGKPGKPDASEIVRAAIDLWFARHPRHK